MKQYVIYRYRWLFPDYEVFRSDHRSMAETSLDWFQKNIPSRSYYIKEIVHRD